MPCSCIDNLSRHLSDKTITASLNDEKASSGEKGQITEEALSASITLADNSTAGTKLFINAFIYCADTANRVVENGWLLIDGEIIKALGSHCNADCDRLIDIKKCLTSSDQTIDLHGKVLLPGFINPHWHESFVAPCFERPDDSDLTPTPYSQGGNIEALGSMFGFIAQVGERLSDGEALAIARWSLWTQLRSGTTALGDVGSANKASAMAKAAIELGMRLRVSRWGSDISLPNNGSEYTVIADYRQQAADWQALCEEWNDHNSGLVGAMPSVMGAFGSSDDQLQALKNVVDQFSCPYATHLSPLKNERAVLQRVFGKSAVERFEQFDLITDRLLAVHTAYASDSEYERLLSAGVKLCHSPAHYGMLGESTVSETKKLASLLQQGTHVSTSTDGDITFIGGMGEAMRATHLNHNEALNDNTACPPTLALASGTRFGAEALGWGERIGSIEIGKKADLVTIDNSDYRFKLGNHPLRTFLVTGSSADVSDVYVAGECVVNNGRSPRFNEEEIFNDYQMAVRSARSRIAPK